MGWIEVKQQLLTLVIGVNTVWALVSYGFGFWFSYGLELAGRVQVFGYF
jgi:hypothetical protein